MVHRAAASLHSQPTARPPTRKAGCMGGGSGPTPSGVGFRCWKPNSTDTSPTACAGQGQDREKCPQQVPGRGCKESKILRGGLPERGNGTCISLLPVRLPAAPRPTTARRGLCGRWARRASCMRAGGQAGTSGKQAAAAAATDEAEHVCGRHSNMLQNNAKNNAKERDSAGRTPSTEK